MVDQEWDVILIGAGQNNFALGAYLGMAGLKTVVCESRLENGGRLTSEELLRPGYWNNTLWYFVDNVEHNPVWQELDWTGEHHATFIVVGTHGRNALHRFIVGSTTDALIRRSPVPLVVVPVHEE